jgi:hypothetical protein
MSDIAGYPIRDSFMKASTCGYMVEQLITRPVYWCWKGGPIGEEELPSWVDTMGIDMRHMKVKAEDVLKIRWEHPCIDEHVDLVLRKDEFLFFDYEPRVILASQLEKYYNFLEEQRKELMAFLDNHFTGIRVLAETLVEIQEVKRNYD